MARPPYRFHMDRRQYLRPGALGAGASPAGCSSLLEVAEERDADPVTAQAGRSDDWQYDPDEHGGHSVSVGTVSVNGTNATDSSTVRFQSTTASAGGAGSADLCLTTSGGITIADRIAGAAD